MYYVVDQSNPKEPMEYIRVTRKDIYKLKTHKALQNGNATFKK